MLVDSTLIDELRSELPELPDEKRERFMAEYELSVYDAGVLTASQAAADYFEAVSAQTVGSAKTVANWIRGDLAASLNRENLEIDASKVGPGELGALIDRIEDGTLSGKLAKDVFEALWAGEGTVDEIIEQRGLKQITDASAIETLVDEVIAANPEQVEQFRSGKDKVLGFLVGQVMKASQGKANPQQVNALLREKLKA